MAFNLKLYKGWDAYIEVTQAFVPGIIKTLIDGIAFISNMENVSNGGNFTSCRFRYKSYSY